MNYHHGFLLGLIMTVSGCATLHPSTAQHTMTPHWRFCHQAPMLLTDLTHSVVGRRYALPNGQACWNLDNETEAAQ
ncbi:MAG: hypothetical protein GY821_13265 [Gammaproteobacteria bacterium]|nr:hypothetical protein [Gammaproteobacteria bacterium]